MVTNDDIELNPIVQILIFTLLILSIPLIFQFITKENKDNSLSEKVGKCFSDSVYDIKGKGIMYFNTEGHHIVFKRDNYILTGVRDSVSYKTKNISCPKSIHITQENREDLIKMGIYEKLIYKINIVIDHDAV